MSIETAADGCFYLNEIIEAAIKITRAKGAAAVIAGEVDATPGVSSRPLFTYSDTAEELKKEVYLYAKIYIKSMLKTA